MKYLWLLILLLAVSSLSFAQDSSNPVEISLSAEGRFTNSDVVVAAIGENRVRVSLSLLGGSCPVEVQRQAVDVVLLIDVSDSMGERGLNAAKRAASAFVNAFNFDANGIRPNDQIAVVSFAGEARLELSLSSNLQEILTVIDSLSMNNNGDGTQYAPALRLATDILAGPEANFEADAHPVIVMLTDGSSSNDDDLDEAERARRLTNADIITIGYGNNLDTDALEELASAAAYSFVTANEAELETIYQDIALLIQPPITATDILVSYTIENTSFFVINENNITPPPSSVTAGQVQWNFSALNADELVEFSFEVEVFALGANNLGQATIDYIPCEAPNRRQDSLGGPTISLIQPTPSPQPSPTNLPTLVPTISLPTVPTPDSVQNPPFLPDTSLEDTGVLSPLNFCVGGDNATLPITITLTALVAIAALAWIFIWARSQNATVSQILTKPCFWAQLPLLLYLPFLAFVFVQPLAENFCAVQESIYFWRLDANDYGIYRSHEDASSNIPMPLDLQAGQNCAGCHNLSAGSDVLSFSLGSIGDSRLGLLRLDRNQAIVSSPSGENTVFSALSPDGSRLVVSDSNADIYIYELSSGSVRPISELSDASVGALMPTWKPESNVIAVVRTPRINIIEGGHRIRETSGIYEFDLDTATIRPVPNASDNGRLNYYPSYSPDGRYLAFTSSLGGASSYLDTESDIWLADLEADTAYPINDNALQAADSWPDWNTDGSRMAFATRRADASLGDIMVVDIVGGQSTNPRFVNGASEEGILEYHPIWGETYQRVSMESRYNNLLFWLYPLPFLFLLFILCQLNLGTKKPKEDAAFPPLGNSGSKKAVQAMSLPSWNGLEVLWQAKPTLIIALGHSGWHVASQIKKNLDVVQFGQNVFPVDFMVITDGTLDQDAENRFGGLLIDKDELVQWRDNLRDMIDNSADDPILKGWVEKDYFRNRNVFMGFHGERVLGRLALINNLRGNYSETGISVWEMLKDKASPLVNKGNLNVVLVADLSDGVGSGAFLDMAYLCKQLRKHIKGLQNVHLVGHFLTERAVQQQNVDYFRRTNALAALRELARFQLSAAPFPMVYGVEGLDDKQWNAPLYDEILLYDGEGERRYNTERGIYPALADVITLWLDEASDSNKVANDRSAKLRNRNDVQEREGRMMLSSMGIYQYRLPFSDLLSIIGARYARQLLQMLLMGRDESVPNFQGMQSKEVFGAVGQDVKALIANFLTENFVAPRHLSDDWRYIFRELNPESDIFRQAIKKARLSPQRDEDAWRLWLGEMLELILNGIDDAKPDDLDIVIKRGAKLRLADDFLSQIGDEKREGLFLQIAKWIGDKAPHAEAVGNAFQSFARIALEYREQLRSMAKALGVGMSEDSLIVELSKYADELNAAFKQVNNLETRRYILDDIDTGRPLSDVWYERYMLKHIEDGLCPMVWRVSKGRLSLVLELAAQTKQANNRQTVIFDGSNISEFGDALISLGTYFASSIREEESLASIFAKSVLHRDQLEETANNLLSNSGIPLGYEDSLSRHLVRSLLLSISGNLSVGKNLEEELLRIRRISYDLLSMNSEDPFSMSLVQIIDNVALDSVKSVSQASNSYLDEATPRSLFVAEVNALKYERRFGEIEKKRRILQPMVVTALAQNLMIETYLLAVVSGEWEYSRQGLALNTLETGRIELLAANEISLSRYGVLMDGLLRFLRRVDEANAQAIYKRYLSSPELIDTWYQWLESEGQAWLNYTAPTENDAIVQDLIAIARLHILELLQRL